MYGEEKKGINTRTLARLDSPRQADPGGAGWEEAKGAVARHAREWTAEIWPQALWARGFLL